MADRNVVPLRSGAAATSATKSPTKSLTKNPTKSPTRGAASRPAGDDALAAGAARASGERAKRRRTPLIWDPSPDPAQSPAVSTPASADPVTADPAAAQPWSGDNTTIKAHRPRPVVRSAPVSAAKASKPVRLETQPKKRSKRSALGPVKPGGQVRPVDPAEHAPAAAAASAAAALAGVGATSPDRSTSASDAADATSAVARGRSGLDELVKVAITVLRGAARASGLSGDDVERQVAQTLAFLRRRLSGDYTVDEFGFDEDFTEHAYLPLLRPLYTSWFRVEVRGIENIPGIGGALVVANHSGTIALDSLMTQVAVHDEHPAKRHLRMLGADLVFQTPVVGDIARKSGSTLAGNPDAERLLASGELAGVWPEGFKGVGKPFSERYKLQRFGRGGFVSAALRTGVPIVPCSIVGAEEIYPILGNLKTLARLIGVPYVPITPTFPLLGPLGLIPLPSKWIIEFGAPVDTASLEPGAAEDPMVVFDLTDQVRETIQQTLYSLLMQRRSVFF